MKKNTGIYGRTCAICGRFISENNLLGIGSECFKALRYAQVIMQCSTEQGKMEYYNRDLPFLKPLIEKELKKKLKNKFKIQFLNSIKDAASLSKKQREILLSMLDFDKKEYDKHMQETKEYILDRVEVSRELLEIARRKIRDKNRAIA